MEIVFLSLCFSTFVLFFCFLLEPHRFVRGGMNPLRIRLDVDPEIIVRPGEAILVSCILIFWVLVILWFIKKWGKIRTLEPTRHRTDTDISSFSQQTRFTSIGGANIPQVHTSDSRNSLELVNCTSTGNFQRPRLNSVFLVSPSRRSSLLPEEYNIPRRYKSAEDLKSLVLQITQTKGLHTGDLNVHKSSSLQPPQCLSSNIYNGKNLIIFKSFEHQLDHLNQITIKSYSEMSKQLQFLGELLGCFSVPNQNNLLLLT